MNDNKNKTLMINIATVVVILGLVVVGYFVFVKKDEVSAPEEASVQEVAFEAITINAEVRQTQQELQTLKEAVDRSKEFFANVAFSGLVDHSINVSPEAIRRDNPFVAPKWKTDLERAEQAVRGGAQSQAVESASLPVSYDLSDFGGI